KSMGLDRQYRKAALMSDTQSTMDRSAAFAGVLGDSSGPNSRESRAFRQSRRATKSLRPFGGAGSLPSSARHGKSPASTEPASYASVTWFIEFLQRRVL